MPGEAYNALYMGLWKEYFHWSVLLRWDVLGWIIPALLAVGGLVLIFDQFAAANVCFMLTTIFIFAKVSQLAVESHSSTIDRLLFTFVLFGLFGIGIAETVRGVNHWAESKRKPKGQYDATLDLPTPKEVAPEPPPQKQEAPPAVQALRRPIKDQADMLRNWIRQTAAQMKVNEMWLSQIFQRHLDNIPDGPDVDVPSALRYLEANGEVEILETSHREYRTWWRETFQEDIRFKVVPRPPQVQVGAKKSSEPSETSQENQGVSNNANTQIGTTQGPVAIAPNGIANAAPNQGTQTVNNGPPPPQFDILPISQNVIETNGTYSTKFKLTVIADSSINSLLVQAESPTILTLRLTTPGPFQRANSSGNGVFASKYFNIEPGTYTVLVSTRAPEDVTLIVKQN
jgi:hypothetical protein